MSNSMDFHHGYLQCLKDLKEATYHDYIIEEFVNPKTEEHQKELERIGDEMYKAYNKRQGGIDHLT